MVVVEDEIKKKNRREKRRVRVPSDAECVSRWRVSMTPRALATRPAGCGRAVGQRDTGPQHVGGGTRAGYHANTRRANTLLHTNARPLSIGC
ncbi:hypothetical protein RR48_01908 [Papilio machaon]|uniref:Uncharacterized protein n=1 Tax=Papilio machaon TaxID=76193 RepID=A0A0N0PCY7_PAPMA|nr:hypothetical protein RR48_01908 [Papilio machaon]